MIENRENFKRIIDFELSHVHAEKLELNENIFSNISFKDKIKNIWNREIEISVRIFTGVLCISIAMVITFNASTMSVTEQEIQDSKVKIVSLSRGGI